MMRKLTIVTIGTFKVMDAHGKDLTPRGRKACGLLALVALSQGKRRSRSVIQDKLWSDRGAEQGAASLRQTLSEIRRALGPHRDCLITDTRIVALDTEQVAVDLDDGEALAGLGAQPEPPTLLEGLEVRDAEFQHWLRDQRAAFENRISGQGNTDLPASVVARPAAVLPGIVTRSERARPWVRFDNSGASVSESARFLTHIVSDAVAKGLREGGDVEISPEGANGPGLEIAVDAALLGRHVCIRIAFREVDTGAQVWSDACTIAMDIAFITDSIDLKALVHRTVTAAGRQLRRLSEVQNAAIPTAYNLAFDALEHLFSLKDGSVERADAMLAQAFEQSNVATLLAWRGYARTFQLGEAPACDWDAISKEADSFVRQALERDPDNSTVLALASYVQSFAMRNYAAGCDLAEKSLTANPNNPLALAFLGRAQSYLGNNEVGHEFTSQALKVVGNSPYTYTIYFLGGMTALLTGRYEEAVRLAEVARALAPNYKAPQRYLVPLYLKTGRPDQARDALRRMHELEPNFSLSTMREQRYPSTGMRQAGLLDLSDSDFSASA